MLNCTTSQYTHTISIIIHILKTRSNGKPMSINDAIIVDWTILFRVFTVKFPRFFFSFLHQNIVKFVIQSNFPPFSHIDL